MTGLDDLYQDVIIDHNNRPRNFRRLEEPSFSLEGYNPLCGDRISLDVRLEGDRIADIGFIGSGCAISRASSSMMTERVKGKTKEEVEEIFEAFHQMVTREPGADFDADDKLGDLEALSGVPQFPVRVKCAVLPWHTLRSTMEGQSDSVSTE